MHQMKRQLLDSAGLLGDNDDLPYFEALEVWDELALKAIESMEERHFDYLQRHVENGRSTAYNTVIAGETRVKIFVDPDEGDENQIGVGFSASNLEAEA